MSTTHVSGRHYAQLTFSASESHWILDWNGSFYRRDVGNSDVASAVVEDASAHDNLFTINGIMRTTDDGAALLLHGTNTTVIVGETGVISSGYGIVCDGPGSKVQNFGRISDLGTAIHVSQGTIENFAYISGADAISMEHGTIYNSKDGRIDGGVFAIEVISAADEKSTIRNDGILQANYAFIGGEGDETIINHGVMKGELALGTGNDVFDTRGGTVDHDIDGDGGNDVVLVSSNAIQMIERVDGGYDKVKSTVSYTLSDYVEELDLLGRKNIDGTGNSGENFLFGNAGDNLLNGMGGIDILDGKAGNDLLKGGSEGDVFKFATGYDRDTIVGYEDGIDSLDLTGLKGISSFADLKSHHTTEAGGNLIITVGDDVLKINGFSKNDFNITDVTL